MFVVMANPCAMDISSADIHVEAVDDLPILLAGLEQLGMPDLFAKVIGTHGTTRRYKTLENGQALILWLLFLLSQADHRKYTVSAWVAQHRHTLQLAFVRPIMPDELSDDRLSTLLDRLSCQETQVALDDELAARTVHVYQPDGVSLLAVHLDGTTTYGFHAPTPEGLMQLGRGKDGPHDAPNVKLMAATVGAGHYLTGVVAPGSAAEDPLYRPVLTQAVDILQPVADSLLFVGDAKFAALESRALCHSLRHSYLTVMPSRHEPAGTVEQWVEQALAGEWPGFAPVWRDDDLLGYGYERTRVRSATVKEQQLSWTERVLLVWSAAHAKQQMGELRKRLAKARKRLEALRVMPKQGRTVYRTESDLQTAVEAILTDCRVIDLLKVTFAVTGSGEQARYRVATVVEVPDAVLQAIRRLGWRVYLTNAASDVLPLAQAILTYRGVPAGVERFFHLLKGRSLGLHPLFVRSDEQIRGLLYLLTLASRVLTYLEGVARKTLRISQTGLTHLILNNLHKAVEKPTIRQLLEAVCRSSITLVIMHDTTGAVIRKLSSIPVVVEKIIHAMRLPEDTYLRLIRDQ